MPIQAFQPLEKFQGVPPRSAQSSCSLKQALRRALSNLPKLFYPGGVSPQNLAEPDAFSQPPTPGPARGYEGLAGLRPVAIHQHSIAASQTGLSLLVRSSAQQATNICREGRASFFILQPHDTCRWGKHSYTNFTKFMKFCWQLGGARGQVLQDVAQQS